VKTGGKKMAVPRGILLFPDRRKYHRHGKGERKMLNKVMTPEEAVKLINNGDVVSICGIVGGLVPEKTLAALEKRFLDSGEPRDLTVVFPVAVGDVFGTAGTDHLAHEGMLKRVIGGSYVTAPALSPPPKIYEMVYANKVEAYNLPMGVLMHLHREMAAKRPGLITGVGLRSFVDPRLNGAKMNEITKEDLVEVITIQGKEYLFYKTFPIHAAIIRGTTADEDGNITMEHEHSFSITLYQAMAARNNGGKVIAQVKRMAARGSLKAQMVRVPGILIDAIVIDEEQTQATGIRYDPSASGEVRKPWGRFEPTPMGTEKVLARRALMELRKGYVVNLGFGIPSLISQIALEEELIDQITYTVEHGAIGGVPLSGLQFGGAFNPQAIIDSAAQFDFLGGGGIHAACMAFAEVDAKGNVNVSRLRNMPHVLAGVGGFIDIVQNVKKIVYLGTLTTGGAKVSVENGKLKILQEGRVVKFIPEVQHLTFDGRLALEKGQEVTYITERAVFKLEKEGLVLTEIAPGVDLQRNVVSAVGFKFRISDRLKEMDGRLFRPEPMGLKNSPSWK
jgi:propionate CoA-transferase